MADVLETGLGGGPVRTLDPRARILGAAAFAVVVVSCQGYPSLVAALVLSVVLMVLAGLPVGRSLKRMIAMDGFIVVMLAMLPFTVPGRPLFVLGGLVASHEGLTQAVVIALKANAVVLCLLSLVGSMESVTLGHALHRLGVPAKLVHLLLFTVRYIEVIHQEYQRLRVAMKIRGFAPANSRHTYRSIGYLIGMMLVRAMERSERILQAMQCRGFCGILPVLGDFHYGRRDVAFAVCTLTALAGLSALEMHLVPFA